MQKRRSFIQTRGTTLFDNKIVIRSLPRRVQHSLSVTGEPDFAYLEFLLPKLLGGGVIVQNCR